MRATRYVLLSMLLSVAASCGDDGGGEIITPKPPCSDGVDNDADGLVDYPDDPGCMSASDDSEDSLPMPACSDGRDNDGDGKIDFPNDPGCFVAQADTEDDDCPTGPHCPQCGNGKDDDMNGQVDYPADPGCESAADASEFINNPLACGTNLKIAQLPSDGVVMGELDSQSITSLTSTCSAGAGAPALAYVFQLTEPKVVVASTDDDNTTVDTVLSIRPQMCTDAAIVCNDNNPDVGAATETGSKLTASLTPGTYYLIVQGYDASESGPFSLRVDRFAGQGATCAGQQDCGPGLLCRIPAGASGMVCTGPVCGDGLDDDNDGKVDYPADPGCDSLTDATETDDCPNGPNCPECADGVDNDNDTKTDYPADLTCRAASNDSESCVTSEGVSTLTMPVTMTTLAGATNDLTPTCGSTTGAGRDLTFRLDLPALTSLTLNNTGATTINTLLDTTCGTPVQCANSATLTRPNVAAGTYYYAVDATSSSSAGPLTINVSGTIATGGSCESPLAQSGALQCASGFACKGTAGMRTCAVAQCNDMIDNNGDIKKDYPADPGCLSPSDDSETTVCPGAMCPVCSDGLDNDGDGKTDYPMDPSCLAASGSNEACTSSEPVPTITTAMVSGDTSTAVNDFKLNFAPSCQSSTSTAKDLTYRIDVPSMQSLQFVLNTTVDTSAALFNSACGAGMAAPLACTDPPTLIATNLVGGTYFYVVDGWSTGSGPFTFTVSGKIAGGGSCEGPLAAAGAFTCATGFSCQGAVGSKICTPAQCGNGIDDNGDGKIDFPNDPGCMSAADDSETTVACPGAMCPVCSDTVDNDTDTKTDWPADYGCTSAGGMSEAFCPSDPDFGVLISMPQSASTLAGITDNVSPTCASFSQGAERTFALQLPVPVATLVLDTLGSTIDDTVLSFKDASCGMELGCDDDGSTGSQGLQSVLTVANVSAGGYAVQVDSYGADDEGPFVLNVKGTVAPGTSCVSPLFTSGVLVCPSGQTCTGTPKKCQ